MMAAVAVIASGPESLNAMGEMLVSSLGLKFG